MFKSFKATKEQVLKVLKLSLNFGIVSIFFFFCEIKVNNLCEIYD